MSWGGLAEFGALFAPGMRHEQERRRASELLREDDGVDGEPPARIDLDSGTVVLTRRPDADPDPEPDGP